MKRFYMGRRIGALALCACLGVGTVGLVGCSKAEADAEAVLSYGIGVMAAQTDMAISGRVGNDVVFSSDDFARNLNLSRVDSITVRSLPADTEGELLLGSTRVAVGQTVSESNLSYLCFVAADESVRQASFTFSVNESVTPLSCNVYLLTEENYTPTLSLAPDLSLNVSTYEDVSVVGTLSAYDPDGDDLIFEIVSYPKKGSVRLTDRAAGTYVYTPETDYTGSDSFSYVARDRYGNYSAAKTVSLEVNQSGISLTYVDMQDSPALVAALTLTEAGIMSGRQVGKQYYFDPDRTVSRAEFLVMAMNAAGITDVPACADTGFFDDADIPASMKGYIKSAYSLGYISGSTVDGELCFLPNDAISRAQAAVILDRIVGTAEVEVIPTFADQSEIPVWAQESIYSLNAIGIISPSDGYISAKADLTREQTAHMLAAVMAYVK